MPSAPIPDALACPACGQPAMRTGPAAPFCSQGCKDRDLLQWLSDGHRLPGPPAGFDESARDGLDS